MIMTDDEQFMFPTLSEAELTAAHHRDAQVDKTYALPPWLKPCLDLVRLRLDAPPGLRGDGRPLKLLADRLKVTEDTAIALARVDPAYLRLFPEHDLLGGLHALQWLTVAQWPTTEAEWRGYVAVFHAFIKDVSALVQHFEDPTPLVQPQALAPSLWQRLAQPGWANAERTWQEFNAEGSRLAGCAQIAWAMRCYLAGLPHGSDPDLRYVHQLPGWASSMLAWPVEDWVLVHERWVRTQDLAVALPPDIWRSLCDTAKLWAEQDHEDAS